MRHRPRIFRPLKALSIFILLASLMAGDLFAQTALPVVSEVRIRGNTITEEFLIRSTSRLNEGQVLQPDDLGRAIRALYSLGLFSDVQIFADSDVDEGVALIIAVVENPRLKRVDFEGNKAIKSKTLRKELGLLRGHPILHRAEKKAVTRVLELYREKGYLLAEVTPERGALDEDQQAVLLFRIVEGPKVNLKRITFHGNTTIPDGKLRKQMENTKQDGWWFGGGTFDKETYPDDKARVEEFYRKNGFRHAAIVGDSLYYDETQENLFLDITVEEGPLYTFGKVEWQGNELYDDQAMEDLILAQEGLTYSSEWVQNSVDKVKEAYSDAGYIGAQVDKRERETEDHTIDLSFSVDEGKPWKIRRITIEGNTKTKDRVIRRQLRVWPGRRFQRFLIERSLREVQQLNYFTTVEPEFLPVEDSDELDLVLKLEERATGTASVGAGFSERDGLIGTIALQVPNFMGNGQQLDFQWEFGSQRETFLIGFTEPWMFNTPTSLSVRLRRSTFSQFSSFDQRNEGGSLRVGRRLSWPDYSSASIGYSFEEVSFLNFDANSGLDPTDPTFRNVTTSSINFNFTRDSRDLPVFARSGSVFSYSPTLSGGFLAGNVKLHKHDFTTSAYFPIFWKVALSIKPQLGMLAPYGGSNVPFSELYTPGGVNIFEGTTLRGYPEQGVGPRNANGTPTGGRAQFIINNELTIPVVENQIYLIAFADAGNSWESVDQVSLFDLRRSLGFGVRIMAPVVGILGFDFGWGLDREEVDGLSTRMVTHFQFGPQFF